MREGLGLDPWRRSVIAALVTRAVLMSLEKVANLGAVEGVCCDIEALQSFVIP